MLGRVCGRGLVGPGPSGGSALLGSAQHGGQSAPHRSRPLPGLPVRTRAQGPWAPSSPGSEPPSEGLLGLFQTHHHLCPPSSSLPGAGGDTRSGAAHKVCTANASNPGTSEAPAESSPEWRSAPWWLFEHCHPGRRPWPRRDEAGVRGGGGSLRGAHPSGRAGRPAAGLTSPRPSGLHCGLLNPGGPAGRGGGAVWETSSEGWEGCWHQKWLGLLWASSQHEAVGTPSAPLGPSPRGLSAGAPCVPLHKPQSQGRLRALTRSEPRFAHLP